MESISYSKEFLTALPKTDLHVHLDGSLRLQTIIELAEKDNIKLPYHTVEELREHVYKERHDSLEEYLKCFSIATSVMQSRENLERVAFEFAEDNFKEGVRYFEVRFAPQLHAKMGETDLDICEVIRSVNRGLHRAAVEANKSLTSEEDPEYKYAIIVSALRMFTATHSEYYKSLFQCHEHEDPRRIFSMASMALATAAVQVRDTDQIPVVALDIAGAEEGYPASQHTDAYLFAHKNFLNTTCHAGEGYGPSSIFQAIMDLHADRIGHGFHIFSVDLVDKNRHIKDAEAYVRGLVKYIAQRRIALEVCLTSNLGTMPGLKLEDHALKHMLAERLSVTICTDNRLVSSTTTVKELALASSTFKFSPKTLKDVIIAGFKRSFFPEPYTLKRKYVRKVMDYYEKVANKFGVVATD